MSTLTRRPPLRMPKICPVNVIYLRADNDANGNPRRCFIVSDHDGRYVETIDEGYHGESALYSRWPWFNSYACERLGLRAAWPTMIDAGASEYRRATRRDHNEMTASLRDMAARYERRFDPWGKRR